MSYVASVFLSVPFSSVHLERLFSNIDLNMCPRRNQIGEDTIESILINKEDSDLKSSLEKADINDKYLNKLFKIEKLLKENPDLAKKNSYIKQRKLKLDEEDIPEPQNKDFDEIERDNEDADYNFESNEIENIEEVFERKELLRNFKNLSIEVKKNDENPTLDQTFEIPANKLRRKREEYDKQDKISEKTQKLRQFTLEFFCGANNEKKK